MGCIKKCYSELVKGLFVLRIDLLGVSIYYKAKPLLKRTKAMAYSHRLVSGIDVVDISDSMDLYSVPELKNSVRILHTKRV